MRTSLHGYLAMSPRLRVIRSLCWREQTESGLDDPQGLYIHAWALGVHCLFSKTQNSHEICPCYYAYVCLGTIFLRCEHSLDYRRDGEWPLNVAKFLIYFLWIIFSCNLNLM